MARNIIYSLQGKLYKFSSGITRIQIFFDYFAYLISFIFFNQFLNYTEAKNIFLIIFGAIFSTYILHLASFYKSQRISKLNHIFLRLIFSTICSSIAVIVFLNLFFSFNNLLLYSYLKSISYYFLLILINHYFVQVLLRLKRFNGGNFREIIYCGPLEELVKFIKQINNNKWMGYKIVGWYSKDYVNSKEDEKDLKDIVKIKNLEKYLKITNLDRIFLSDLILDQNIIKILGNTTISVTIIPYWVNSSMIFNPVLIGNQWAIELWGKNEQKNLEYEIKKICDFTASILIILVISPFLAIIALLIKLNSKGPIIYKQTRYGLKGKQFEIYKFRTMFDNYHLGKELKQAQKNDIRVTSLGRILRKWSIDELPQLVNVLRGEMSLVGPRPHAKEHNEFYRGKISGYMQRHNILPGITGLSQVSGLRGETKKLSDMEKRVASDMFYLKNWSINLDINILLKTVLNLNTKSSY